MKVLPSAGLEPGAAPSCGTCPPAPGQPAPKRGVAGHRRALIAVVERSRDRATRVVAGLRQQQRALARGVVATRDRGAEGQLRTGRHQRPAAGERIVGVGLARHVDPEVGRAAEHQRALGRAIEHQRRLQADREAAGDGVVPVGAVPLPGVVEEHRVERPRAHHHPLSRFVVDHAMPDPRRRTDQADLGPDRTVPLPGVAGEVAELVGAPEQDHPISHRVVSHRRPRPRTGCRTGRGQRGPGAVVGPEVGIRPTRRAERCRTAVEQHTTAVVDHRRLHAGRRLQRRDHRRPAEAIVFPGHRAGKRGGIGENRDRTIAPRIVDDQLGPDRRAETGGDLEILGGQHRDEATADSERDLHGMGPDTSRRGLSPDWRERGRAVASHDFSRPPCRTDGRDANCGW